MKRNLNTTSILWLTLSVVMILAIGCSKDYAPITGTGETQDVSATPGSDYLYPPVGDLLKGDGPAPGFRFLQLGGTESTLDGGTKTNCDSLFASQACRADRNNNVNLPQFVKLAIPQGSLQQDITVRVAVPSRCLPVADFYPHPYQFSGPVEIRWQVKHMGLPANFDYSTMVPWYVDDAGNYIPVQYRWVGDYDELVVTTNHFSRYIIGQRIL